MSQSQVTALPRDTHRREPLVPNGVLGMLIFVVTEIMFFAGLVSAYMIAEGLAEGGWPPPDQPRLPITATAVNTGVLLLSGVTLFFAGRARKRPDGEARAQKIFLLAMVLGAIFVSVQGFEWVQLIGQGLTLTFSTHGAFFYLIVGTHAAHAVVALLALFWAFRRLRRGELTNDQLWTVQLFWYFVVGVWPVLYNLVYL